MENLRESLRYTKTLRIEWIRLVPIRFEIVSLLSSHEHNLVARQYFVMTHPSRREQKYSIVPFDLSSSESDLALGDDVKKKSRFRQTLDKKKKWRSSTDD